MHLEKQEEWEIFLLWNLNILGIQGKFNVSDIWASNCLLLRGLNVLWDPYRVKARVIPRRDVSGDSFL